MKNNLLILLCIVSLLLSGGCKKKSDFDPATKSQNDFIGNWKGVITAFKNNQYLRQNGLVVIYPDAGGSTLSGILFAKETSVFRVFQYANGTIYFKVECNDPENPKCQNWSLSGYAVFLDEKTLDFRISGNECGAYGEEFISWSGSMAATPVPADSIRYFCFAKTGNTWTYETLLSNGSVCQLQRQIAAMPSDYFFTGIVNQTCTGSGFTKVLKWSVTPDHFTVNHDSTLTLHPVTFAIDAKPGVVYKSILNLDTTTLTLLDTNTMVTTVAGNFLCNSYRYTEPVVTDAGKVNRASLFWISKKFGVIKQEVNVPVDTTDIQTQVLTSKNF